jgi:uncharacterized damage-inducible protein DinB
MDAVRRLCRYNAWANERVLTVLADIAPALLDAAARGSIGTVSATLKHLVLAEDHFLAALRDRDPVATRGPEDVYLARELPWFASRLRALGEEYQALLAEHDATFLPTPLAGKPYAGLTNQDGLLQVFTHSAHHRAQILSALGTYGLQVPDIDYLVMTREGYGTPVSSCC